ncbi:MAG: hypothetical protein IPM53_27205 [Anaerolineaceae bacterium]|nr:hypothetical protein [Anaerolineaceae bacterium]
MEEHPRTITGPFGRFTRQANGLIYFYKQDDLAIDVSTAQKFLDIIRQLDNSGEVRIIVVQGHGVEYSFDAQRLLLKNDVLSMIAYVIQTGTQYLTAELLQDVAKSLKSQIQVEIFQEIEAAEAWLLEEAGGE